MSVTRDSIDSAEWTQPFESSTIRNADGVLVEQIRDLPWAFLRFGDVGEERKYVVPTNYGNWISASGLPVAKVMYREAMPYQAWPLESARVPGTTGGPIALHFYGPI